MLQQLRDASNRPLAKILMGVLIFSFVGWGAANWILGEGRVDDAIIRVGGAPLKLAQFEQERGRQLNAMTRDQQRQVYTDRAAQVYFTQTILTRLTSQIMFDLRAHDLGLSISNAGVAMAIRNDPTFQENGRFSNAKFDTILYSNGISESAFAEWMRAAELRTMLISSVTALPGVPDFVVNAMFNARYTTRKIEFATVKFDDFKAGGTPTDSQLAETYAKNQKTVPEFRTISYVMIPAKMSEPDDHDRAFAVMQRLEDALIGGESMSSAATKHKAKFVKLNPINAGGQHADGAALSDSILTDSVLAMAFATDEGIESEIIETKSGFVILRVEKIEPAHIAKMESMQKELAVLWRRDEQKKAAYIRANEILSAANAGKKSFGTTANVTRTNGAPLEVLSAAFAQPVGMTGIVPGANAFYVLSVKEVVTPKPDAAKMKELKSEAEAMLARTITEDYSSFLNRKYPVKVNNRLFKRLFGEK